MSYSAKVILSITLLTALIVGVSITAQGTLGKTSGELEKTISKLEYSTTANDWQAAETGISQISSKWTGIKGMWAVLIDHQEIDNIDITISRVEKFIRAKDAPSAMAETSVLKNYIGHVPEMQRVSFKNIF